MKSIHTTITNILITLLVLCLLHPPVSLAGRNLTTTSNNTIRIAFGSCLKPRLQPDPVLNSITNSNPDVFVWLGDVAYTDTLILPLPLVPVFAFPGPEIYRTRLEETKNLSSYQRLRSKTQVVGVWDDHDYGMNDGGIEFKDKEITQPIWLDFIDEPADSPRRNQKGIWDSYYIGKDQKIKLILVDSRYYKNGRFSGNDTLGEVQWEWLENEFKNNKAELVLIGNGYRILPDDRFLPENWFYESKERLYDLMNKYKVNGVVLMSGDVHAGEIMHNPCSIQRTGYDLYEITSSGMTHTTAWILRYFAESWMPPTYHIGSQNTYQDLNFGIIDVNLTNYHVSNISLQIRNRAGDIVREQVLPYSELLRNEARIGGHENCSVYSKSPFRRLIEYHITHFLNPSTLEGKRGVILYLIFLGILLVGLGSLYLFVCVCMCRCCCGKRKRNVYNKEKLN